MAKVTVEEEDGTTTVINAPSVTIGVADPSPATLAGAVAAFLASQDPEEVGQAAMSGRGFRGPPLAEAIMTELYERAIALAEDDA